MSRRSILYRAGGGVTLSLIGKAHPGACPWLQSVAAVTIGFPL
jgi:hypothetical protein